MEKYKIVFMRHAQSDPMKYGLNDRSRPISLDGMHELESIKQKTNGLLSDISLIICSNAKRAMQTLDGIRSITPMNSEAVFDDEIYQASTDTIWGKIRSLDQKYKNVMIIGHNPTFSQIVNSLNSNINIGTMPTCSIVVCIANIKSWKTANSLNIGVSDFYIP